MKITIVSGARPNFMKIAPICRAIQNAGANGKNISYRLVYAGPEDDPSLEESLFFDLGMEKPDAYLGVSGQDYSQIAAAVMLAFEKELDNHPAQVVLVVDDLCQETRSESGSSHSRHPFLRYEHAARSEPYHCRCHFRLSVYSRHGSQPESESGRNDPRIHSSCRKYSD